MSFHQRLKRGEKVLGTMISEISNPNTAVMLATAGLDFFLIDMEHGTLDYSDMAGLITAGRGWNVTPAVRIPEIRRETVLKPLDAGASVLVVPQVEEVAEVEEVVSHAMYPHRGRRGVALRRPHSAYAKYPAMEYMEGADKETLVLVQIETRRGLENVERLAEVEGLGGFFIGPFDLSVDMGLPGEVGHPDLREAFRRVIAAAHKHGRVAAIHVFDPRMAIELMDDGINMCSVSSDINMLVDQATDNVRIMRESIRT
ncbi:2-keto-3-deoxy-L-rhamnonate aldolase RhmA [Spinactinospora alkalitolerans]|uniref:2-keto-3-deoxy-L-rhamnonate aldolase RhmA n=1 Tax=Spinactinospora alkalitolerans TaxID=687207 RepID=A0A852TVH3_9ACTN|nr:aldolase/citrate lyase family protein [Spinactinospora alkalitolerans]NYE48486.1 2-keto-3-deoxy-L-rhamnonate aldolase RhmA [Spinactinospora alkalitolerans]